MTILNHIRRIFARHRQPAPRVEYVAASELPADPSELVRRGVVRPWRRDAAGQQWYRILARPTGNKE